MQGFVGVLRRQPWETWTQTKLTEFNLIRETENKQVIALDLCTAAFQFGFPWKQIRTQRRESRWFPWEAKKTSIGEDRSEVGKGSSQPRVCCHASYHCGHPNLNPQGKSGTHTELSLTVRQASDRWFIYQLSHGVRAAPGGVNSPALWFTSCGLFLVTRKSSQQRKAGAASWKLDRHALRWWGWGLQVGQGKHRLQVMA